MKFILLLLFFCLSFNSFGQNITEAQRDFYTKVLHGQDSVRFNKTTRNAYKYEEFNESDFYNQIVTQREIDSCNKLIRETAQLHLDKEKNKLIFTGNLTDRFNIQTTGIFSIDLLENNLSKESGEKFELHTSYNSNSGYGKIDFKTAIKSDLSNNEKLEGFVKFNLNYLVGYDKIELSANDIGRSFKLNNCSFTVIEVKENELILKKDCEIDIELNIINFNKENKVAKPYSYFKLIELVKEDSTISMESFNRKNRETYIMVRNIFESNPKITLKEFREIFTVDKLNEMKKKGKYTVVESIAPYGNKFVIYSPQFQSHKIKVQIK